MEGTFGQKLRALRRAAGMTQRQLALQVGVDFSYISKLENHRLPPPAADTVMEICNALKLAPEELFAGSGKIPSKIEETIASSAGAIHFLFTAEAMKLSEAEWGRLREDLERLRD